MTAKPPVEHVAKALSRKKAEPPKPGALEASYRTGEDKVATKKATFELPQDLHRALHLHAVGSGVSMRDLVIRYIENGLREDSATS